VIICLFRIFSNSSIADLTLLCTVYCLFFILFWILSSEWIQWPQDFNQANDVNWWNENARHFLKSICLSGFEFYQYLVNILPLQKGPCRPDTLFWNSFYEKVYSVTPRPPFFVVMHQSVLTRRTSHIIFFKFLSTGPYHLGLPQSEQKLKLGQKNVGTLITAKI